MTCFGMFDGHGGAQAADLCLDFVPKYLAGALVHSRNTLHRKQIESVLSECIAAADQEYIRYALASGCTLNDTTNLNYHLEHKTLQASGTTACVVRRSRAQMQLSIYKSVYLKYHIRNMSCPVEPRA